MRADDQSDHSPDERADPGPPTLLLTAQPAAAPGAGKNPQPLTVVAGRSVSMPETDPERVAFNLWNEGRVDEAIEFLEHEIAAERDRGKAPSRRKLSRARRKILGDAKETIAPAAGPQASMQRRPRLHRLASADFSATGDPVGQHALDLLAVPADQVVPPPPPRRGWPLAIGLCLVAALALAGAIYVYNPETRRAGLANHVAPAVDEPTATASISSAPAPAAIATGNAGAGVADGVDVPPPEDDATDESAPPVEDAVDEAPAKGETTAATVEQTPTANSPVPPAEVAALTDARVTDAPDARDASNAPVADVRLPRQRPEPPPEAVRQASAAAANEEEPTVPLVLGAPPANLQPPWDAAIEEPQTYEETYEEPIGPGPYYGPPRRTTLSPEEYQSLVERRALAEEYAAERRAEAEDRREYHIIGRVLPRWRRLGF